MKVRNLLVISSIFLLICIASGVYTTSLPSHDIYSGRDQEALSDGTLGATIKITLFITVPALIISLVTGVLGLAAYLRGRKK